MSAPPRPSSSVRHLSQAGVNISPPAVLPQYPPSSYPPRTPSVPQAPSASEVRHAPSSVMNGHGAPPPDTHRHFRGPNRGDDEPPQPSGSQAPPTPAPTGEMKVQKKRARRPSTSQMPPQSPSSPKLDGGLPSVLVREKKQKACANCRRAKLKCIVETDGTDCVRCKARKERCIFYPRSHVGLSWVTFSAQLIGVGRGLAADPYDGCLLRHQPPCSPLRRRTSYAPPPHRTAGHPAVRSWTRKL